MVHGVQDLKPYLIERRQGGGLSYPFSLRLNREQKDKLHQLSISYGADIGAIIRALISSFDDSKVLGVRESFSAHSGTIEHPLILKVDALTELVESYFVKSGSSENPSYGFSPPPFELLLEMAKDLGECHCELGLYLKRINAHLPEYVTARFLYQEVYDVPCKSSWIGIVEANPNYPFPVMPAIKDRDAESTGPYEFVDGWKDGWTGTHYRTGAYGYGWFCVNRFNPETLERFVYSIWKDLNGIYGWSDRKKMNFFCPIFEDDPKTWFTDLPFRSKTNVNRFRELPDYV